MTTKFIALPRRHLQEPNDVRTMCGLMLILVDLHTTDPELVTCIRCRLEYFRHKELFDREESEGNET